MEETEELSMMGRRNFEVRWEHKPHLDKRSHATMKRRSGFPLSTASGCGGFLLALQAYASSRGMKDFLVGQ
jgi:hypothetical protein